jgi:L-lactate dehydrogenase complex protein LldF
MPSTIKEQFVKDSEANAFDLENRHKIQYNISKYDRAVEKGLSQFSDMALAGKRAKNIKWKAIEALDSYLLEFEKKFEENGGKVIWAENSNAAIEAILKIIKDKEAKTVVKSKSMATEEIELNEHLEKADIEVLETDLGEFIVQLAHEKPYHIVTPAMHKSREDVAKLFHEKLGSPEDLPAEELTMIARQHLREKFKNADIGITGANFLIADTGSIAITENEGNARLTTAFPKTHIAIVGIEKMIPNFKDLGLFWPLLAARGTGQKVTVYNSVFSGPKQAGEKDGPGEMFVILLDNGRSKVLQDIRQRESLYCIRCGACLNACPVYKTIGGHAYNTTYSGPIGSVISPVMTGYGEFGHLSFASSLCGNCSEVCPVGINLHEMLINNRKTIIETGNTSKMESTGWQLWQKAMLKRKYMNMAGGKMKQFMFKRFFHNTWGKRRATPEFPKKSFNQLWDGNRGN